MVSIAESFHAMTSSCHCLPPFHPPTRRIDNFLHDIAISVDNYLDTYRYLLIHLTTGIMRRELHIDNWSATHVDYLLIAK